MSAAAAIVDVRRVIRPLAPLTLAALCACAAAPRAPEPSGEPWPERRAALQAVEEFVLRGRVAISNGEEGFNASLRWEQEGGAARLALEGPFGVGGLQIETAGGELSLRTARGEALDGAAAREALERELGFALPLASLRYWVLGVPDPALPAEEVLNQSQQLVRLVQDGWQVEYGPYRRTEAGWRPQRLVVRRDPARVRLVIDRWAS